MSDEITVRYFAAAQAAAGTGEERIELPSSVPLAELLRRLAGAHGPELARVLGISSFLVDGVNARPERVVPPGATLDVLPPFAGG